MNNYTASPNLVAFNEMERRQTERQENRQMIRYAIALTIIWLFFFYSLFYLDLPVISISQHGVTVTEVSRSK